MKLKLKYDCSDIDWDCVSNTLKNVGMAYFHGETHRKAFENSYVVVFAFDDNKLIGFGRAISDGIYQSAIYDVAISPEYRGKGIGTMIINNILERISETNVILYTFPEKEVFYEKLNFRKMKTGMALFYNAEEMRENGFAE
ncbi:GNAT family N-acetyltransferase [Clostridium frigidicarnis]|uniref:Acetyltransferase (GNAT) domain-containing protein n=1 Tax=Clostridium frigidicarnis TaxID=84698 RepID=A0A1I0V8R4_9CLOT|nr:GNAT family N-acetyltransferase [Clostridium frigidicarnis]SFA72642.1 Acetyltransferase (GNAT) domain-containing protein [Clostridium frigidicarnis]